MERIRRSPPYLDNGSISLNSDCTGTLNANVYQDGEPQRTAVIALVFDNNVNHGRSLFESLTLPNGTNVPVVITIDSTRLFPRED